ncbi:major facilitator superfamily transporter [Podospora didyma]|uniref:Major facilitator superfamily transporter n=1 Tax=Podospora didyma TaxID=330526 RepID=A0AAE0NRR4_9PEZI|nr:major facilitator superfamily transporter [Podospora didyma]
MTIVSTAIPAISQDFQTTEDVGWYGSGYFLTMCAFLIFWGRLYTFFNLKGIYIASIVIFEGGSLICAVAPRSEVFILGRAIAGLGGGGAFAGSLLAVAFSVPVAKRPMYASLLGAVYGMSNVFGPIVGGAFVTSRLGWRGCFYMNLPLGAIVIGFLVPFFTSPVCSAEVAGLSTRTKLKRMDPLGTVVFIAGMTSLLLTLQWGGQEYPWSGGRIIALLVVFAVTICVWVIWQVYLGPIRATVPKTVLSQRSFSFTIFYAFCQGGVNFVMLYFTPIWFQGVQGFDAAQSGVRIMTFVLGMGLAIIATGYAMTTKKARGYSAPFMFLSVVLVSIACGLLTTWTPDTGDAQTFGYLALYGLGQGFGWQQPIVMAQTLLPRADIATGTALSSVCKLLGGTIFVSASQNLFNNKFRDEVVQRLPEVDSENLLHIGITELRKSVDTSLIPVISSCYNDALRPVWWLLLALSLMSLFGAAGVKWKEDPSGLPGGSPKTNPGRNDGQLSDSSAITKE